MKSVKEMIEVMLAYEGGRQIQVKTKGVDGPWIDVPFPAFDWFSQDYRVKPIPDSFDFSALSLDLKYVARDSNGDFYAYTNRPLIGSKGWNSFTGRAYLVSHTFSSCVNNGCDWRDSLQTRPETD